VKDPVLEDEVIESLRNFINNVGDVGQSSRDMSLSEGEEHNSDELDSGVDTDEEDDE